MQKIDANIVLRYVLEDHTTLSPKAKNIIDNNETEVPVEVLCEVVFVLSGLYNIARPVIQKEISDFFVNTKCQIAHDSAVMKGLEYFGKTSLDFVDCLLAGYFEMEGDEIQTFDGDLRKLIEKIKMGSQP
jgi:predicted nucleic-acid-binding protein